MAKRTGNSSVNSSIRQQTSSNEEGFGKLLEAQQASLGELSSIRKLLELSRENEKLQKNANGGIDSSKTQEMILDIAKQQLKGSRTFWKTREEMDRLAFEESAKLAELASAINTSGNFLEKLGESLKEKKEGVKEKFGIANGGLKKTVLGALNVGGVFNKTLAKDAFKAKQKALGNEVTDEDAEGAYNTSKEIKAHDKKISALKAKHGISDEEFEASTAGKEMLLKKEQLTNQYRSYDKSAKALTPDATEREINFNALPSESAKMQKGVEPAKTATSTAAEAMQGAEVAEESKREQEKESSILQKIEENTRGGEGNDKKATPEKPTENNGEKIFDKIIDFLGPEVMMALKSFFNPKTILKFLGKAFAIGAIVGALFEGIMDGFDEFMKTGDIGKALIAGLAGIVDFLTFGLFDKEKIKEVIGDMAAWVDDHIVKPIGEFFSAMKDSFLSFIQGIGIPEIKFKIPVVGKEVSIGPFYPFKSDGMDSKPKPEAASQPNAGNIVEQKSADNANTAATPSTKNNTSVVNAPVTNNSNTTQVIRSPIRNQESSVNKYTANRYA
jgi:hypothetical protein